MSAGLISEDEHQATRSAFWTAFAYFEMGVSASCSGASLAGIVGDTTLPDDLVGAALSLADQFAAGAAAGAPATAGLAPGKPSGAPVVPSPKEILDAIATYVASKSGAGKAGGAPGSSAGAAGKAGGTVGKAGGYSRPPGQ